MSSTTEGKTGFGHSALVASSIIPGLLLLLLPLYRPEELPYLLLFVGRFHPLILHFPIVLIILALLFEVARRYHLLKIGDAVVMVILMAAALSTFVAVVAGYMLFASGEYSGRLMDQHFWGGLTTGATVFFTLAFFALYKTTTRFYWLYFVCLLISNGTMAYTGHLGGSITHGADYLSEYLPMIIAKPEVKAPRPEQDMLVYEDMIAPIFEAKCMSCHNDTRAKGGFRMSSHSALFTAGESGRPSVTPKVLDSSEVFKRVTLAEDHEDHMPPEGKTPLTGDEVALLEFWIKSGGAEDLKVAEIRSQDTIGPVVESIMPELAKYRRKQAIASMKVKDLKEELDAVSKELGVFIYQDSLADDDHYAIAMKFPPARFTNNQFMILAPYEDVFSRLSLVSSGIDDAGLYYVSQMANVKSLYLQKTNLDGSGLIFLQKMPNLETLNLSFTHVDDKAAIDLLNFPKLREVYLFRTKTSDEVAQALMKYKPGLIIHMEEGPYY